MLYTEALTVSEFFPEVVIFIIEIKGSDKIAFENIFYAVAEKTGARLFFGILIQGGSGIFREEPAAGSTSLFL